MQTTIVETGWAGVGSSVGTGWTGGSGGGDTWCGTSVEFYWIVVGFRSVGGGTGVEMRTVTRGGNFQISVGTRCLWCVVEVGCAVEGRGRFVRGVCGN